MTVKGGDPTAESSARPGGRSRRGFLLGLMLVAAGIAAFHNSFQGRFVLDDHEAITRNDLLSHPWPPPLALWNPPQSPLTNRPLVTLTLLLNHRLGGLDPWGYHLVNLGLHIASALTLFGVVRRTLCTAALAPRFGASSTPLGAAVALLWMVHPIQAETVTYVIQRTELLAGLCLLQTLYCSIRGFDSASAAAWTAGAVIWCFLGVAGKEVMATAPVLVLLYDRTFLAGGFRQAIARRPKLYAWLAGSWVPLAAMMALGPLPETIGFGRGISAMDYLRTQAGVIVHYLRLCVWPRPLLISQFEWPVARTYGQILPAGLLVVGLLTASAIALSKRPVLGFLGVWFFAILSPTSSFVPMAAEIVAVRRMYLPLAAVACLVVVGGHLVLLRIPVDGGRSAGRIGAALTIAVAAALTLLTIDRNRDYADPAGLWLDVLEVYPHDGRAWHNLGLVRIEKGDLEGALQAHQKGLELDPADADGHLSVGHCLVRLRRHEEAIESYRKNLRMGNNARARACLAHAQLMIGRLAEAEASALEALRLDPASTFARLEYAGILAARGRTSEAVAQYREVLRLSPSAPTALNNLAWLLAAREPDATGATEAVALAERLNRSTGGAEPDALDTLGVAYAAAGRYADAVRAARAAAAIAEARGMKGLAEGIRVRIALFEAGRPYLEAVDRPATSSAGS